MMRPFIPLALATHLAGGLRLGTNVTSKEQPKPTPPTKEDVEASDTCDCLYTGITSASDYLTPVGYYGSSCGIWDKFTGMPYFSSGCGSCASKSCENANCMKAWCYVSHTCTKLLEVEASDVFSGAYWSYFPCQSPKSNKGKVLATYVKEAVEVYAHLTTQEDDIDKLCKTEMKFEKLKESWTEMCDMADESDRIHGMWGMCQYAMGDLVEESDKEACAEARKHFNFDLAYLSGFEKITRKTLQIMIRVVEEMQEEEDDDKEFEDWSENLKDEAFNDALAFYNLASFPLASEEWLTQKAKEDDINSELLEITIKSWEKKDYKKQESAAYTDVEKELYEDYHMYLKGLDKVDLPAEQKYLESLVMDLSDELMEELKESLKAKKTSVASSIEVPIPEKKKPKIQDPVKFLKEKKELEERVEKAIKDLKGTAKSKKVEVMKIEGEKLKAERKVPAKSPDKAEKIAKIEKMAKEEEAALDLEDVGDMKKPKYNSY